MLKYFPVTLAVLVYCKSVSNGARIRPAIIYNGITGRKRMGCRIPECESCLTVYTHPRNIRMVFKTMVFKTLTV